MVSPTEYRVAGDETRVELEASCQFWLGILYAGIAGYIAVAVATTLYLRMSGLQVPGSAWIIIGIGMSFALVNFVLRHRIVRLPTRRRLAVFSVWSGLSFILLAALCIIDGGISSPLATLLPVPLIYLALGYPLSLVIANGLFGLVCCGAVIIFTPAPMPWPHVFLQSTALIAVWLLALFGALAWGAQNTILMRLRRQLSIAAATDELTNCLNQPAFSAALTREIARAQRYGHSLALLIIDIDNFKTVNDQHGHLAGDGVLRHVATVLRNIARATDTAGRPGGDELALIAPEISRSAAIALAERLREQLSASMAPIPITVSVGICATLAADDDANSMFHRADRGLYAAKHMGRDQAVCGDEGQAKYMLFANEERAS